MGFHLVPVVSLRSLLSLLTSYNSHLLLHKGSSGAVEAPREGGKGSPSFLASKEGEHCVAGAYALPHSSSSHDKGLEQAVNILKGECRLPYKVHLGREGQSKRGQI